MASAHDTRTIGFALEVFQRSRCLSQAELADWLHVAPESLPTLASLRLPEPDAADFILRCSHAAHLTGCDAYALRTLLRWVRP